MSCIRCEALQFKRPLIRPSEWCHCLLTNGGYHLLSCQHLVHSNCSARERTYSVAECPYDAQCGGQLTFDSSAFFVHARALRKTDPSLLPAYVSQKHLAYGIYFLARLPPVHLPNSIVLRPKIVDWTRTLQSFIVGIRYLPNLRWVSLNATALFYTPAGLKL